MFLTKTHCWSFKPSGFTCRVAEARKDPEITFVYRARRQHVFSIYLCSNNLRLLNLCVHRKDILVENMLTPKYLKLKSWSLSTSTSKRGRSNDLKDPLAASNIFESKEHTSSLFVKFGNSKKNSCSWICFQIWTARLDKPLHGHQELSCTSAKKVRQIWLFCCCCYYFSCCYYCYHAQTTSTRQVKLTGMPFYVSFLRRRYPFSLAALLLLTGGSTLCGVLRNGCHSWVPKPCHVVRNESFLSHLTTYYHVPDSKLISKQNAHTFM